MNVVDWEMGDCDVPGPGVKAKRVVVDLPEPLFEAAEDAAAELEMNRSTLIREAVRQFLNEHERQKLEIALAEGYVANAASALAVAEEMMGAEADFS